MMITKNFTPNNSNYQSGRVEYGDRPQLYRLACASDRLALISAIVESLQDTTVTQSDRSSAIRRMRGLLKTEQPVPTDK